LRELFPTLFGPLPIGGYLRDGPPLTDRLGFADFSKSIDSADRGLVGISDCCNRSAENAHCIKMRDALRGDLARKGTGNKTFFDGETSADFFQTKPR
jgi:hypothetical protein